MDEQQIIRWVQEGNHQAFSSLVDKYRDIVFSIALKVLRNREDAEEIAQETFIKAFQSIGTFKGNSKFSTWLYSITYNNCMSELRKKKISFASLEDVPRREAIDSLHGDNAEEIRVDCLQRALKDLPAGDYTLILLYYYEGQSIEEISTVTGLSESNVKIKLFRARKRLQTSMENLSHHELYQVP